MVRANLRSAKRLEEIRNTFGMASVMLPMGPNSMDNSLPRPGNSNQRFHDEIFKDLLGEKISGTISTRRQESKLAMSNISKDPMDAPFGMIQQPVIDPERS